MKITGRLISFGEGVAIIETEKSEYMIMSQEIDYLKIKIRELNELVTKISNDRDMYKQKCETSKRMLYATSQLHADPDKYILEQIKDR